MAIKTLDVPQPCYRYLRVDTSDIKDNAVQVAFSSEYPGYQRASKEYERLGIAPEGEQYVEVLSHDEGDYDLTNLNRSGAFLDEHVGMRHLGFVRKAAISTDKVGRAALEFDGASKLSKTRQKQVTSGSRPNISFGYDHTRYIGPVTLADGRPAHRFAWKANEISSVADPMDPTVGARRGKQKEEFRCIGCGGQFDRAKLDADFYCEECADAADPNEGEATDKERVHPGGHVRTATLPAADETQLFRAKVKGKEIEISHAELKGKVSQAADNDKRFKTKRPNGNVHSDFYVHDIHQTQNEDGQTTDWKAIIVGPEYKVFGVSFNYDGKDVELGDHEEVEPKQKYEPVERMNEDGVLVRSDGKEPYGKPADADYADPGYQKDKVKRYPLVSKEKAKSAWRYINMPANAAKYAPEDLVAVRAKIKAACKKFGVEVEDTSRAAGEPLTRDSFDMENFVSGLSSEHVTILRKKLMAEKTELTPELVIDSLENPHVRKALETKGYVERKTVEAEAKTRSDRFAARNTEIKALETEFVRDFGGRIGGKAKEKYYLRDKIALASLEAQAMDATKPDTEVRQIFRSKVDDLKRDSTEPGNILDAVNAPEDVASKCDLFGSIRRMVSEAKKRGLVSNALTPFDGAEKEANDGIRAQLAEVPGGGRMLDVGGFMLPHNARAKFAPRTLKRGSRGFKRDALAEDFATAGAFIQPEFQPYIELLRNRIVMAELGATYVGGLVGDVVFPRQEAATVGQSVAEGAQLAAYDQVLGQIKMAPHRVGSRQYYSRLAVLQSTPDFEAFVWNDHSKVIALYIDEMAINGSGAADQPVGILNMPGINQLLFGGTPTYTQIVNFRTQIRKYNVMGPLAFCTTSVGQGRLAVLPETLVNSTVVSGSTAAIWHGDEEDGDIIGAKALASQQIPGDILLAGVYENLILGSWGGLVSVVDNYTRADRDEIALTLNTYFDTAVRHAQAFTRSGDSCNQ